MQTLGGAAYPSLDSLTAWFSDHGNHQEGQSREDGLGGKRWGTSAEEEPSRTALWVLGLKSLLDEQGASVG